MGLLLLSVPRQVGTAGGQACLPTFSCSAKLQNPDKSHDLSYQTKSENRSSDGPEMYNPRFPILWDNFIEDKNPM